MAIRHSEPGCWAAGLLAAAVLLSAAIYAPRADAAPVPFPTPRPAEAGPSATAPPGRPDKAKENGAPASAEPEAPQWTAAEIAATAVCLNRLAAEKIVFRSLPTISGPGACGAVIPVRLEAVVDRDGRQIALTPAPTLRCTMVEAVVKWLRDDVSPTVAHVGGGLKGLLVASSFDCRGRNRIAGAQLSEHGLANAIDVSGLLLANKDRLELTDRAAERTVREKLRDSACARFTTVLGPGSDGYHETHIHLDAKERRGGYRICQWDVSDPAEVAAVPMPRERPSESLVGNDPLPARLPQRSEAERREGVGGGGNLGARAPGALRAPTLPAARKGSRGEGSTRRGPHSRPGSEAK